MSIATLILGESGTGKSASMRNLNPNDACLIQIIKKPLPFKSSDWKRFDKETGGNVFVSDDVGYILGVMNKTKKEIIIIDDFQYLMANEFMRGVTDEAKGNEAFMKFNKIAQNAWYILNACASLPDNKRVYVLSHTQTNDFGHTKAKTIGKLLDEKITLEGMFSIVLRTKVLNGSFKFLTQNNGMDTTKSPIGLFDDLEIDNDLNEVDLKICEFYDIERN